MFFRAAWILIPLFVLETCRAALADVACGPIDAMAAQLGSRWKEGAAFAGVVNDHARMDLFVNAESRTWTILVTRSDGISCMLLSGSEGDVVQSAKHPGDPT